MSLSIKETIKKLREEINFYNKNYYELDESLISDFEFDAKLLELQNLEKAYPEFDDDFL